MILQIVSSIKCLENTMLYYGNGRFRKMRKSELKIKLDVTVMRRLNKNKR